MRRFLMMIISLCTGLELLAYDYPDTGNAPSGGLAGAFTAYENETEALYYNPAGYYHLRHTMIGLDYNSYLNGLVQENGLTREQGYYPVDIYSYSFSLMTRIGGFGGAGLYYHSVHFSGLNNFNILGFGLCLDLKGVLPLGKTGPGLGLVVKYVESEYLTDNYNKSFLDQYNTGSSGFSLDTGLLINLLERLKMGISLLNILNTDIGLENEDLLTGLYRIGFLYSAKVHFLGENNLSLLMDFTYENKDFNLHTGAELEMVKVHLKLRGGVNFNYAALGVGYEFHDLVRIDYAINYYISGFEGLAVNHKMSLGVSF